MATAVPMVGQRRVKPSVYLSPIAQPISNNPARIRIIQFTAEPRRQRGASRIEKQNRSRPQCGYGPTLEPSGRRRQVARPGLPRICSVPQDGAGWPAAGARRSRAAAAREQRSDVCQAGVKRPFREHAARHMRPLRPRGRQVQRCRLRTRDRYERCSRLPTTPTRERKERW